MYPNLKLILVIGATGAQGVAVIDKLLEPCEDGSPSSYAVRALTRDPGSRRAKALAERGVECVRGAFDDFGSVHAALQGVYGVWVNTDGFTVGEQKELWTGIRIFEIAKQVGTIRHYVWSSLDNAFKRGNYNPIYKCDHYDGKGRVADWMKAQPTVVSDDNMSWTIMMFGPLKRDRDGTAIFATPIGKGHIPMIALSDLGFFARYTFDNRAMTSGQELEVASDWVGWEYLVETFQKVTGQKAVVMDQSLDDWFANFEGVDKPVANERQDGDGSTTWRSNFSGWWALWRDDIIKRDMEWVRRINPRGHTLESWMRATDYTGDLHRGHVLKNSEDGKTISPRKVHISQL
ncbi:NAD(P)-binding protein [Amylocystis lapponica]|nr:NAD(P)-binding protein [Amylocystis lapponica]